jgi:hypothetical protein
MMHIKNRVLMSPLLGIFFKVLSRFNACGIEKRGMAGWIKIPFSGKKRSKMGEAIWKIQ